MVRQCIEHVGKEDHNFSRLHNIHLKQAYFVTRAKSNLKFKCMYSNVIDKTSGVLSAQIGVLEIYKSKKDYPNKFRRIKYYNKELDRQFI